MAGGSNQQQLQQHQQQQTMQQQLQQDVYLQPTGISAGQIEREKYEHKHGLESVRAVVESLMPGVYDRVDLMRSDRSAVDLRKSVLHHARGRELQAGEDGNDVLEFDMAGSSFQTPRADYSGFKGKGTAVVDGKTVKVQKQLKISWINKLRAHMWLPGGRTPDEIVAENARRLAADPIYQRYGASQEIGGVLHEHVRKKVSGSRTKISIAGSQALNGSANQGEYSIESTRGYMLELGKSYLTNVFDRWRQTTPDGATPLPVHILLRGHSRGGVTAVEGAMMLKQWVLDNYPGYLPFVKFDLIQMDPVPGIGSRFGVNKRVDLRGTDTLTKGHDRMAPLGDSAETTVVYSLHTEHTDAFTPQAVLGAKRVILMADKHHVSLNETDRGIVQHGDGTTEVRNRRAVFTDAESGEAYRGSGLSSLGEGVYIADETNTLIHLTSYAQAQQVISGVLNGNKWHADRHAVINEVVKAWFDAHPAAGTPAAGNG